MYTDNNFCSKFPSNVYNLLDYILIKLYFVLYISLHVLSYTFPYVHHLLSSSNKIFTCVYMSNN